MSWGKFIATVGLFGAYVVEESYNPDRTRLSLEFAKKQTIKTSEEEKEPKRSRKGANKRS